MVKLAFPSAAKALNQGRILAGSDVALTDQVAHGCCGLYQDQAMQSIAGVVGCNLKSAISHQGDETNARQFGILTQYLPFTLGGCW